MGCAVVGLVTDEFDAFAGELLAQRNASSSPLVVVKHPVGGISRQEALARISGDVVENVIRALQVEKEGGHD